MKQWLYVGLISLGIVAMASACGGDEGNGSEGNGSGGSGGATLAKASGDVGLLIDNSNDEIFRISTINDEEADVFFCYEGGECESEGEFDNGGGGERAILISVADSERELVGISVTVNISQNTEENAEAALVVADGEHSDGLGAGDFEIDREIHRTDVYGADDEHIAFDVGDVSGIE